MLSQLTIQNFGLIEQVTVDFMAGLTVFTGETGAGKSILIDAVRFALGERFDTQLVRDRTKSCRVEAVFDLTAEFIADFPPLREFLNDNELQLIINREWLPDGRARLTINHHSVARGRLQQLGNRLLDVHGPHDHQLLLAESSHREILDRLGADKQLYTAYAEQFAHYQSRSRQLRAQQAALETRTQQTTALTFDISQLEQISWDEDAYTALQRERTRLLNTERLCTAAQTLLATIDEEQFGLHHALSRAFPQARQLTAIDDSCRDMVDILTDLQLQTTQLRQRLAAYIDALAFDPERDAEINRRYELTTALLRTYGPTVAAARQRLDRSREQLAQLQSLTEHTDTLHRDCQTAREQLSRLAQQITARREKTARALKKTIERELKQLGFTHIEFYCRIEPAAHLNQYGADEVRFFISPNAGEELKPLAAIVSSGEAARVMLALKKALTAVDPVPVLVFDEIDAQIGGRLGSVTGKKLKELSRSRQVILITHLPQIASFADNHFKISKQTINGKTMSTAVLLNNQQRTEELAQMMGAEQRNQVALSHAQDMLTRAHMPSE